jgi:hypothetical protein
MFPIDNASLIIFKPHAVLKEVCHGVHKPLFPYCNKRIQLDSTQQTLQNSTSRHLSLKVLCGPGRRLLVPNRAMSTSIVPADQSS